MVKPDETGQPEGLSLADLLPRGPVPGDMVEGAAHLVMVRVEKYRPGREAKGTPDEVVERGFWVDARTGREIVDPERIRALEARRLGRDTQTGQEG